MRSTSATLLKGLGGQRLERVEGELIERAEEGKRRGWRILGTVPSQYS